MHDAIENLVALFERGALTRTELIQGLVAAVLPIGLTENAAAASDEPTFRGRAMNHVTLSVTDPKRSMAFYRKMLGGSVLRESELGANLGLPDTFIGMYKLGEPKIHHFCVGVEDFTTESALEKLQNDFPASQSVIERGRELYFRDPDGILGQVSAIDYRGAR